MGWWYWRNAEHSGSRLFDTPLHHQMTVRGIDFAPRRSIVPQLLMPACPHVPAVNVPLPYDSSNLSCWMSAVKPSAHASFVQPLRLHCPAG